MMLHDVKKVNTAIFGPSGALPSSLSKEGALSVKRRALSFRLLDAFFILLDSSSVISAKYYF